MRNADQTAEEYRDWLIGCLHRYGHDELIALICPYGEDDMVKAMLDIMYMPDCEHAEHDGLGCLGYCGCYQDDEPIESCKNCEAYTGNKAEMT